MGLLTNAVARGKLITDARARGKISTRGGAFNGLVFQCILAQTNV